MYTARSSTIGQFTEEFLKHSAKSVFSRTLTLFTLTILIVATLTPFSANGSRDKKKPDARPTLRIAKGSRLEFLQYAAANGSTYGPGGKLKIDDINKAWADVSDVVIDGTLEIKRTDPNTRATAVFVANKLTMNDGGRIVTHGNVLIVFVNQFISFNNASIIDFEDGERKAGDGPLQTGKGGVSGINGLVGPPGNPGQNGEGGGLVQIFAANFSGPIRIDLSGQDGGSASKGGGGGDGRMGSKGENADWVLADCKHDGGGGGTGGAGGTGGIGGAAGRGGDGGLLSFFYVTSISIDPPNNPKILVISGKPGSPGDGGPSGTSGEGGLGGDGGGPCHGGPRGAPGGAGGSQGGGASAALATNGSQTIIHLSSMAMVEKQFQKAAAM